MKCKLFSGTEQWQNIRMRVCTSDTSGNLSKMLRQKCTMLHTLFLPKTDDTNSTPVITPHARQRPVLTDITNLESTPKRTNDNRME